MLFKNGTFCQEAERREEFQDECCKCGRQRRERDIRPTSSNTNSTSLFQSFLSVKLSFSLKWGVILWGSTPIASPGCSYAGCKSLSRLTALEGRACRPVGVYAAAFWLAKLLSGEFFSRYQNHPASHPITHIQLLVLTQLLEGRGNHRMIAWGQSWRLLEVWCRFFCACTTMQIKDMPHSCVGSIL